MEARVRRLETRLSLAGFAERPRQVKAFYRDDPIPLDFAGIAVVRPIDRPADGGDDRG